MKLPVATVVLGIAWNAYDFIVHGLLLGGTYASNAIFRQDAPMVWLIVADFVAALVFLGFYDRVCDSFGGGVVGGAPYRKEAATA